MGRKQIPISITSFMTLAALAREREKTPQDFLEDLIRREDERLHVNKDPFENPRRVNCGSLLCREKGLRKEEVKFVAEEIGG